MISNVNSQPPWCRFAPWHAFVQYCLLCDWNRVDKWVLIFYHAGDCHFCTDHLWTKSVACLASSWSTSCSSHHCGNQFWAAGTWWHVPSAGVSLLLWAPQHEAPTGTSPALTPASPECPRELMPQGQPSNDGRRELVSKCSSPPSAQSPWFLRWPSWGSSPRCP